MPDCTITVRILEGRNLLAADRGGTSDPYAIIRVDSAKYKTKVIKKTLNPKWMETFKFNVLNPKSSKVIIEVWDKDFLKKDDPLGCLSVPLTGLEKGVEKLEWYNLNGVPKGQLYIGITADNFDTMSTQLKSNYPSSAINPLNSSSYPSYPPQSQGMYPPPMYSSQPNYSSQLPPGAYPPPVNFPPPQYDPSFPSNQYPPQLNIPPPMADPYSTQAYSSQNYPPPNPGYPPQPNAGYPPQPNNYPPQQTYASQNYPPQSNPGYPPQSNPGYPPQSNPQVNSGYPPQPNTYSSQQNYPPQPNYGMPPM